MQRVTATDAGTATRGHRSARAMGWCLVALVLLTAVAVGLAGGGAGDAGASGEPEQAGDSGRGGESAGGGGLASVQRQGEGAAEGSEDDRANLPDGAAAFLNDRERFAQAMQIIEDIDAALAEEIRQVHARDAARTWEMLQPHMRTIQRMQLIRSRDPSGYELRIRDIRLARRATALADELAQARHARDRERAAELEKKLRELVGEHFDLRQRIRRHEVEQFEKRIEQLKQGIETRQEQRDTIIQQKLRELLGRAPTPDF